MKQMQQQKIKGLLQEQFDSLKKSLTQKYEEYHFKLQQLFGQTLKGLSLRLHQVQANSLSSLAKIKQSAPHYNSSHEQMLLTQLKSRLRQQCSGIKSLIKQSNQIRLQQLWFPLKFRPIQELSKLKAAAIPQFRRESLLKSVDLSRDKILDLTALSLQDRQLAQILDYASSKQMVFQTFKLSKNLLTDKIIDIIKLKFPRVCHLNLSFNKLSNNFLNILQKWVSEGSSLASVYLQGNVLIKHKSKYRAEMLQLKGVRVQF